MICGSTVWEGACVLCSGEICDQSKSSLFGELMCLFRRRGGSRALIEGSNCPLVLVGFK